VGEQILGDSSSKRRGVHGLNQDTEPRRRS
jgi:hypothetical protein